MVKMNVLTADEQYDLTPKEAIGKSFVTLGSQHHNYGQCYELVCYVDTTNSNVISPYLSLMYTFEYKNCKVIKQVPITFVIQQVKLAIHSLLKMNQMNAMYQNYMAISSSRCLDNLLLDYSFYRYQVKMAEKIQLKWMYHYYTPTSEICRRIRTRQFMCLQEELTKRPKFQQD